MLDERVAIVDPDLHRRCSVARSLYDNELHAEPFESCEELRSSWPKAGLMLIHNDDGVLSDIFNAMVERNSVMPTIIYSVDPKPAQIVDAVLMGAMDYLAWPFTAFELRARLKVLLQRRRSFSELRRKAARARKLVSELSAREREVLFSLANGASNKSIAHDLSISPRTVEIHRSNMMGKLGASHVSEAISVALYADFEGAPEGSLVDPAALL